MIRLFLYASVLLSEWLNVVQSRSLSPPSGRCKTRLYCDICEVFDEHDTDDCPTQSMDGANDEDADATRYHGDRSATRPYCDNCESFGHETVDCAEDETF